MTNYNKQLANQLIGKTISIRTYLDPNWQYSKKDNHIIDAAIFDEENNCVKLMSSNICVYAFCDSDAESFSKTGQVYGYGHTDTSHYKIS